MYINILQYLLVKFIQKLIWITIKFHFPNIIQKLLHKFLYNYTKYLLKPYFHIASQYLNKNYEFKGNNNSSLIWVFWWQGTIQMPNLVKKCIRSIKYNSGNHKVILINRNNVYNYANLPQIVYKKVNTGKLDLTHFSDILRFNILDKYGGLWVDSTIYCTSFIDNSYFKYLYTTGGYKNTIPKFVKGRWTEFLIGGNSNNNMLKFVDKFLQLYFSNNNLLISYFLADYALDYSYEHNLGNYRWYVDNFAEGNNPHLFVLAKLLNKSYNNNKFKMITKDTNMFKLTYKNKFVRGNTFYNEIFRN